MNQPTALSMLLSTPPVSFDSVSAQLHCAVDRELKGFGKPLRVGKTPHTIAEG